jgi:hypothetical protein
LAFFLAGLFPMLLVPPKRAVAPLAEVAGATVWTQDRARDWWATHQPVLTFVKPACTDS